MDVLIGTWREISADNIDGVSKAIGLPQAVIDGYKQMGDQVRYTVTKSGDIYTVDFNIPGMPPVLESFQLGVEKETKDIMENNCKVLHKRTDEHTYVETRSVPGKYVLKNTRTYATDGNSLTTVGECGSAKSTAVWQRC